MGEERLRILKMTEEGKISLEEANELLVTMEAIDHQHVEAENRGSKKSHTPNSLEINIDKNGKKINISVRIINLKRESTDILQILRLLIDDKRGEYR